MSFCYVSPPTIGPFPDGPIPRQLSPSHRSKRFVPLRRLCLFVCSVVSILQIILLHRRLLPIGASFHSNPKVPEAIGRPAKILLQKISRNETESFVSSVSAAERRLPDCLIIGVRKGGTRALLDALALHARIRVARHEVHFFDRLEVFRLGSEWYRAQMPGATAKEVVVEKTPAYFTNPAVPKRVYALNSSMKMILIVREPVARTISDFTQVHQTKMERHKEPIEFQRKSFVHSPNGSFVLNTQFRPIRNSLYSEHFGRWLEHFSKEQFLVLDGDKFIRDPLSQIRLVEHFLRIGPGVRPDQLLYNHDKGFYCFRHDPTAPVHCLGRSKGRLQMRVTEQFRQILSALLKPYNRRFFSQLNAEFLGWK
uniref:Sulfotransferase domain-containing protein n=1 Tax=Globodera rostochiensis TaxID=31243 RepID=A0A914H7H7_GLORO